jgi:hypothetical protein
VRYDEPESIATPPRVEFSLRALDTHNGQAIWSSFSHGRGDEGVFFFDVGRISTAQALSSEMVGALVARLDAGDFDHLAKAELGPSDEVRLHLAVLSGDAQALSNAAQELELAQARLDVEFRALELESERREDTRTPAYRDLRVRLGENRYQYDRLARRLSDASEVGGTPQQSPGEGRDPASESRDGFRERGGKMAAGRGASVEEVVRGWAKAWSRKHVDDYLASYSESFRPPHGMNVNDWETLQRILISRPNPVAVVLGPLRVDSVFADSVRVEFRQTYLSVGYDAVVDRTLELTWEGDRWRIVHEHASLVSRAPDDEYSSRGGFSNSSRSRNGEI